VQPYATVGTSETMIGPWPMILFGWAVT